MKLVSRIITITLLIIAGNISARSSQPEVSAAKSCIRTLETYVLGENYSLAQKDSMRERFRNNDCCNALKKIYASKDKKFLESHNLVITDPEMRYAQEKLCGLR